MKTILMLEDLECGENFTLFKNNKYEVNNEDENTYYGIVDRDTKFGIDKAYEGQKYIVVNA